MKSVATTDLLRSGMARVLDIWRDRFDGANDTLHGVLRQQLADATGTAPPPSTPDVRRAYDAIRGYYDNVRYAILPPTAMVWGTLTNALRVAAQIDSVTETQRKTFAFAPASLEAFVRAAHHDASLADALCNAFRPMPAAACQALAALFDIHIDARLDAPAILAVVQVLGNEGPLTSAEAQAARTLEGVGLVAPAFAGVRSRA